MKVNATAETVSDKIKDDVLKLQKGLFKNDLGGEHIAYEAKSVAEQVTKARNKVDNNYAHISFPQKELAPS